MINPKNKKKYSLNESKQIMTNEEFIVFKHFSRDIHNPDAFYSVEDQVNEN